MPPEPARPEAPDALTRATPWHDGLARGVIRIQSCASCGHVQRFARFRCESCHGTNLPWRPSPGLGTVAMCTEVHRAPDAHWQRRVPYAIVILELDEGTRLMGVAPRPLGIGARARAVVRTDDIYPELSFEEIDA